MYVVGSGLFDRWNDPGRRWLVNGRFSAGKPERTRTAKMVPDDSCWRAQYMGRDQTKERGLHAHIRRKRARLICNISNIVLLQKSPLILI